MTDKTPTGSETSTAQDFVNNQVTPPLIDGEPAPGTAPQVEEPTPAPEAKPQDDGKAEVKSEETPEANAEGDQPEEVKAEEPQKPSRSDKRKEQLQSQINDLTAQKRALERETQSLIKKHHKLQERINERQKNPVDPDDFAAQEHARLNGALDERAIQDTQTQVQDVTERHAEIRQTMFETKLQAASERIPDLNQAIQQFAQLPVSEYAADIIAESDQGPELAYYLAKNPAEAHRIAAQPPHVQGHELARIEGKLSAAPPVRKVSTAPAPPQQVSAANAPTGKSLSDMSMDEYIKARKEGQGA